VISFSLQWDFYKIQWVKVIKKGLMVDKRCKYIGHFTLAIEMYKGSGNAQLEDTLK